VRLVGRWEEGVPEHTYYHCCSSMVALANLHVAGHGSYDVQREHTDLLGCMQVTAGSGDKMVYVWDVASRHLLYKLPGHTGSVNETAFHPNEPIIGSAASDKNIFLGELTE
jgi:WD40 repeat protein